METKCYSRSRLAIDLIIGGVFVTVLGAVYYLWSDSAPALVSELRGLPSVARVDFNGPRDAPLAVVHIRDWHFVPKDMADVEGLDFPAFLRQVEQVQGDQLEVMRHLIRRHGVDAVYSEGLSKDSMAGITVRLDVLRDIEKLARLRKLDAGEERQRRELTLTVGTPGRLLLAK